MVLNRTTSVFVLSLLLLSCADLPVQVERPAALEGNRFVQVENLTANFEIRHSDARRFFYGKGSRWIRTRDERLKSESAVLDEYLRTHVERKMILNGFSPVSAAGGMQPAGLVFRGSMRVELVRGLVLDSTRVAFEGELLSLADGRVVARGKVEDSFVPGSLRRFSDLMNDSLDQPVRVWFETLER